MNVSRPKINPITAALIGQAIRAFPEIEPKDAVGWRVLLGAKCQLFPTELQPWFQSVDLFSEGLLTVNEAASFLRIHRTKLYELMNAQDLPYVKMGKARRIPKVALKLYAEKG